MYVKSTPLLLKILGDKWRLPDAQVWYWQFNYEDSKSRGLDKSWSRQMPNDDLEALIGEHDSVYGQEVIQRHLEDAREEESRHSGILGSGIKERHDPPPADVDYQRSRLLIDWKTPNGIPLEWMLMPLKDEAGAYQVLAPKETDRLRETQKRGYKYSVGIDPGTGVGGDRTAIEIKRVGYAQFPDDAGSRVCLRRHRQRGNIGMGNCDSRVVRAMLRRRGDSRE